jgi:hypothetical protein
MPKPATLAASFEQIHSNRPLYVIADEHATSRVLSDPTRTTFAHIGNGVTVTAEEREAAFFEAAASASTRLGQSYSRRIMLGDLNRLRVAVLTGQPIPRTRSYVVGLPVTVTLNTDGTVLLQVDVSEAADIESDVVNYGTLKADAEAIGVAIDSNRYTVA